MWLVVSFSYPIVRGESVSCYSRLYRPGGLTPGYLDVLLSAGFTGREISVFSKAHIGRIPCSVVRIRKLNLNWDLPTLPHFNALPVKGFSAELRLMGLWTQVIDGNEGDEI